MSQVKAAKAEADRREGDLRRLYDERTALTQREKQQADLEVQDARRRLQEAGRSVDELRARQAEELAAVEARVKATLARKDAALAAAREQAAQFERQLRALEGLADVGART